MMISRFMLKILSAKQIYKKNRKFVLLIQTPISQAAGVKYKDVMTDFCDLLKHVDRRKCEITLTMFKYLGEISNSMEICSYDFYNSKIYLKLDMLIH